MTWKTIETRRLGKNTLRVAEKNGELFGVVITPTSVSSPVPGATAQEIFAKLEIENGKQAQNYVGYEGAKKRFLKLFPDGFTGNSYREHERNYKLNARKILQSTCSLKQVESGKIDCQSVLNAYQKTNLLSPYELMRVSELLKSDKGPEFVRAAARFALGDTQEGLAKMKVIASHANAAKWTILTYLPYLWLPERHMFLKPEATKDFSERVGHPFQYQYESEIKSSVYDSLIELTFEVADEIKNLLPQDHIDIQSFIWIVGRYKESDAAELASTA